MGRIIIDPMDARFMTEAEIAKELGVTTAEFKAALPTLIKEGLPPALPLYANRRYWPAVRMWLDRRYSLDYPLSGVTAPPGLDGDEKW